MIKNAIAKLVQNEDLSLEESYFAMRQIMSGEAEPVQIAGFLVGLRMKGETAHEIAGCAKAMREKAVKVDFEDENLIDTCGTGGDGVGTFNISTVSAIIASAVGAKVAKHGNRSISSKCGSADVLKELGVNIELTPEQAKKCLEEINITFLFAPFYHTAMKYAAPVRQSLGIKTIFNILGPLTNPAGVKKQVIGVFSENLTEKIAFVLKELASEHALVVHGTGGIDEISIAGATKITELKNGEVKTYEIVPEDFGLKRWDLNLILGGDAKLNAEIIRKILDGESGPHRDVTLLNSGAAIYVSGLASSIYEGIKMAEEAIDSGRAKQKLEDLVKLTNSFNKV
ncbi:anthranilate phosphoribosyltransferase [Candidatus Kryptonium thompsonii]|uniref:Anthranilate phosphoribosyltransferase n=1 Tax=Candidatus Kryptonium thompsonii TaxID=1633631 RepID=A0A0P1M8C3_9BACT|nr:anthranilate phosphoribosyltransferase [Candidatus Kryptonium thompsoni]CUS82415.1 anthranilate phosphoribosyltransferase [Candidatus Kryptonium thompsoni]CUS83097.1 anthranilate phosphoribosyltransferase [Candidatus Kryptonium thompsoni]CUS91618.1 anthranilate phosphoribosyltransferase [Candidatus Kryptonium thompsoni]CUS94163.1 anthranilate phosphoribosyltransferase [Candidatus Kryptonium thompsoni]CUS96851.1 anthranilate phosphoribosyltransferase [Candidatus Kryptonium thompsoni]